MPRVERSGEGGSTGASFEALMHPSVLEARLERAERKTEGILVGLTIILTIRRLASPLSTSLAGQWGLRAASSILAIETTEVLSDWCTTK